MEEYRVILKNEIMRPNANHLAKLGYLDTYYDLIKKFTFKELLINFNKYQEMFIVSINYIILVLVWLIVITFN